jgi:hypothetical protein
VERHVFYVVCIFIRTHLSKKINLMDLRNTKEKILSFSGHVNGHQMLRTTMVANSVLISPGSDNFLRAWSLSSGSLLWQKAMPDSNHPMTCKYFCNVPKSELSSPLSENHRDSYGLLVSHGPDLSYWSRL